MSERARVQIDGVPLWRVRLMRGLPRYVLYALAAWGLIASARFAIAPPRPLLRTVRPVAPTDLAARGFAALFARRYLSWSASAPEAHSRALTALAGTALGPEAGMQAPLAGSDRVYWDRVVQERAPLPGEHVYTVAAQTSEDGLVYLAVSVMRRADGRLSLVGYPAFVGQPATAGADLGPLEGDEVADASLRTVVRRAISNYIAPAPSELAADLAPGAQVSLPQLGLSLESVQSLTWAPGGGAVIAVVQALGGGGATYTLAYELDVTRADGRWEVGAIEMDPNR